MMRMPPSDLHPLPLIIHITLLHKSMHLASMVKLNNELKDFVFSRQRTVHRERDRYISAR
jgi:hypothetical protein